MPSGQLEQSFARAAQLRVEIQRWEGAIGRMCRSWPRGLADLMEATLAFMPRRARAWVSSPRKLGTRPLISTGVPSVSSLGPREVSRLNFLREVDRTSRLVRDDPTH